MSQACGLHQPRVFHLLTEVEPFSDFHGGAISRWVANALRQDAAAFVLAPWFDHSWSYPIERVWVVEGLRHYKQIDGIAGRLLRWPIRRWLLQRHLLPAFHDLRPGDTVWIHNRPEFAAALAPELRRRQVKLILHLHNSHLLHWPEKMVRSIRPDRFIFVSHFLEQQASSRFPDLGQTEVLHNGADNSIFYPRPDTTPHPTPVVLFAGRLVPDKGLHVFVEAMRLLYCNGCTLQGIVLGGAGFGDVRPTSYLRQLQQSATPNLTFRPYVSGAALGEAFRTADISCVPSCWQDPMPLVVLEAMASGLPIIATRSGGIPEMLADGGGVLVARNSATELADALELVAKDVSERLRLAGEARASFLKSFTWDVVRTNYQRIVNSVQAEETLPQAHPRPAITVQRSEDECQTLPTSA